MEEHPRQNSQTAPQSKSITPNPISAQVPPQATPTSTIPTPTQPIDSTIKKEKPGWLKLGLISLLVIAIPLYGYFAYKLYEIIFVKSAINSYEKCAVAAGSIVQEPYPQTCTTEDGLKFTNESAPVVVPVTKAKECYEKFWDCPDNSDCTKDADQTTFFCTCMGGLLETIGDTPEDQYQVCMVDDKQYDGISFQELGQGWYWGDSSYKLPGTPDDWVFSGGEESRNSCWHIPNVLCNFPGSLDQPQDSEYLLEDSEGSCIDDSQCQFVEYGCGGGYGICTDNPTGSENIVTTCDIPENLPSSRGYTCGCIETLSKCGWEK